MHYSTPLPFGNCFVKLSQKVTVIDYGVGNLLSVQRGLEHVGAQVIVTSDPEVILASERVVLPGVGAFPNAMQALNDLYLISVIQEFAELGKPLLAICLGMQLLMDESDEFGRTSGLCLIPGRVVQLQHETKAGEPQKIPHIGWGDLQVSDSRNDWSGTLLQDIQFGDATYFVHSYMAQPMSSVHTIAEVEYGGHQIPAVVSRNQITGCQFHPEKSGEVGLKILRRFIEQ
jgi:glutamine amidotransferase